MLTYSRFSILHEAVDRPQRQAIRVKTSKIKWSGKRDLNSRPQPWQGCALPTELFPHKNGGPYRDRTDDLLHAMQALSQLS